jgi:hypothetical protein
MTARRFSSEELYSLRNHIPIDKVIKNALNIPCRISEGCFRFLCPLCNEFNTAVNPATNLARCFGCQKNFNTIDLVMVITQSDFVHSIRFLKDYQRKRINPQVPPKMHDHGLEPIGSVLKSILQPSALPSCGSDKKACNRILALEKRLESLVRRIEELANSLS